MNDLTKRLSAIILRQLGDEATSVSYAIMRRGELVAFDSLGYKNGKTKEKADLTCTYNVASVSKMICTVAVMQLVERGKVTLDAPVIDYLPRFKMPLDERYKRITLRHCLNHSSGLPGTEWRGFSVSSLEGADYYSDVYGYFAGSTLKAEPGEYSVYCNDGFTLAELVVSEVAGVPYAEYCRDSITEPLGMHSSRLSPLINPDYTLVSEGKKPRELLLVEGAAGYTTTMADLCRFGNMFLHESPVLSRESAAEMNRPQGVTFLASDEKSPLYGLGWDNVSYRDRDYDLGDGVLVKGGNSFQFDTQFFVVPKYDAVLAISETHDCSLDVNALIMRLFALCMLESGESIYARTTPVPKETVEKRAGVYLTPSGAFKLEIEGAQADFARFDTRGKGGCDVHDLWWDGSELVDRKADRQYLFDDDGKDRFIMTRVRTYVTGCAMMARDFPRGSAAWEKRVGKKYINCSIDYADEVVYELMTGFIVNRLEGFGGLYAISLSGRTLSGVYGVFESVVHAETDERGRCFLRTPANPSRDLTDPIFSMRGNVEYCDVASYLFRDAEGIEEYDGQPFPDKTRVNGVYRLSRELSSLPVIPERHRVIILDRDLVSVYDSLFEEKYTPVKDGYVILI